MLCTFAKINAYNLYVQNNGSDIINNMLVLGMVLAPCVGYDRHWAAVRQLSNKFGSSSHLAPFICFCWALRCLCLRILCDVPITISWKLSLPYCCRCCITVFRYKVSASRSRQGPGRVDLKIIHKI